LCLLKELAIFCCWKITSQKVEFFICTWLSTSKPEKASYFYSSHSAQCAPCTNLKWNVITFLYAFMELQATK
jgi:hypothetical protein